MDYEGTAGRSSAAQNMAGAVFMAALLGAVVGLLFAPKKGTETREDIRKKYYGMKNMAHDKATTAKERLVKGVDAARSRAHDATDSMDDAVDKAADKTKSKLTPEEQSLADHIAAEDKRRRKSM